MQRAKKVVSDSPGLVDFAIGLENYVINLSDGQVNFFEDFKLQKNCKINLLVKTFLGLVKKMFGLVNVSFSLSEWKAVKRTFFVPCTCYGQFALTLKKESPYIVSTFNPLIYGHSVNTDTFYGPLSVANIPVEGQKAL